MEKSFNLIISIMIIALTFPLVNRHYGDKRGNISMQYYDKLVVGERIKQIRRLRNMTQSNLAEHLDYANERQLQRIENGETGCTIDKLMEIAQILDISTDYLLFGTKIKNEEI